MAEQRYNNGRLMFQRQTVLVKLEQLIPNIPVPVLGHKNHTMAMGQV